MPQGRFEIPSEAQPDPDALAALHGKILANRALIDPEGWNRVVDGLPPCPRMKPEGLEWDVYDPAGGVRVTTLHPANWNIPFVYGANWEKDSFVVIVTHWRDRPKPPE